MPICSQFCARCYINLSRNELCLLGTDSQTVMKHTGMRSSTHIWERNWCSGKIKQLRKGKRGRKALTPVCWKHNKASRALPQWEGWTEVSCKNSLSCTRSTWAHPALSFGPALSFIPWSKETRPMYFIVWTAWAECLVRKGLKALDHMKL